MEYLLDRGLTIEKGNTAYEMLLFLETGDLDLSLDAVIYCYMFLTSPNLSYLICEMGIIKHSIQIESQQG